MHRGLSVDANHRFAEVTAMAGCTLFITICCLALVVRHSSAESSAASNQFGGRTNRSSNIASPGAKFLGPMEQAECIKYMVLFFNAEPTANELFDTICANYKQLKTSAAAAAGNAPKPVVAWMRAISNLNADDYMTEGGVSNSKLLTVQFYLLVHHNQHIQDAGGVPLDYDNLLGKYAPMMAADHINYDNRVAALNMTTTPQRAHAALLDILKDVAVIIVPSIPNELCDFSKSEFMKQFGIDATEAVSIPALTNSRVYKHLGVVGTDNNDDDERVAGRPDLVLANFVAAIHPSAAASAIDINTADTKWLLRLDEMAPTRKSCTLLQDFKRTPPTANLVRSLIADSSPADNSAATAPMGTLGSEAVGAQATEESAWLDFKEEMTLGVVFVIGISAVVALLFTIWKWQYQRKVALEKAESLGSGAV